jgi:hypothetical protein
VCGADGRHTAECRAFFQTFGWDSYEEFKAAVDDPVQQLAAARHLAGLDA